MKIFAMEIEFTRLFRAGASEGNEAGKEPITSTHAMACLFCYIEAEEEFFKSQCHQLIELTTKVSLWIRLIASRLLLVWTASQASEWPMPSSTFRSVEIPVLIDSLAARSS